MDLNNFNEVITFAIRKEAEAYNLYTTYGQKVNDPAAKSMFAELAQQEKRHREILEGVTKKEVETYKLEKIPDMRISDFIDDQTFSPDMDFASALRLAIKREEAAFKLYHHLAEGTEDGELKKLFSVLSQEESKHKLRLENQYDENVMWED
jgi:rubrerythrin